MKRHYTFLIKIAGTLFSAFICFSGMLAANPEKYAQSSVLSRGSWVKVNIDNPGLQTLSRQTLKNFGFADPEKVFVYGYGGQMISEVLSSDHPDDLPSVPVFRKDDGSISFFAVGNIATKASAGATMAFDHTISPYSESSYYFLSDVAPESESPVIDLSDSDGLTTLNSFICQKVHERDLMQCAGTGRDYLGEDFRLNKSQSFNFDLPDNVGGEANVRVKFGATTTGAASNIIISANGNRLEATSQDRIAAIAASSVYYNVAISSKKAENIGNSLALGIEYVQGGTVSMARLDWIEVEYERSLALYKGQLLFTVNPDIPASFCLEGASDQTVVWDVTFPWDIKVVKGAFDKASNTLKIAVTQPGFRQFFAFEPSTTGASVPGRFKVANQDIHALPTPDMVIISPEQYSSAAERIANLHRKNDGMTVHVLTPEKIYNEFSSGNSDVSAFRKLLKMWYDRSSSSENGRKFGYCLLMGRPTYDHKTKNSETQKAGYPRTPIWQSASGLSETSSYCTDDFIGMLDDESVATNMSAKNISISVGRYPVTSPEEAEIVADKLEAYMTQPIYGTWRNNVMVIADDGDNEQHLQQAESAIKNLAADGTGQHYVYEKLYLDAFERKQTGSGLKFPAASDRMLMKWQKEGVSLISYIGHANPKEWGHEKLLTWNDINSMSNQCLPILYAATCSFGKWDADEISGAEILLANPAGGAIALVTPSRTVIISKNGFITDAISSEMFRKDSIGKGQRLGDVVRLGKNISVAEDNKLRYHLFGDPALRIPTPEFNASIDSIAGLPLAESVADAPMIPARASVRISGRITDADGVTIPFNGPLQFTLFDAEKSVKTNGWGDKGVVSVYQDRSSKLATGSTMVVDGLWSTSILMPSEISNNYSPALISLYAYDPDQKLEANGSSDRLFVYGYNDDAIEDTDGPSIDSFAVGSASGSSAHAVHSNPVVIASFSDESGINISDAAPGHKMRLVLDSNKVFNDVSHYFIPSPEDPTAGSIAYPLIDLLPGDHQLTLTVWDNANNSSSETINFKVGLNLRPDVVDISTVYNPNTDMLNLKVSTDRALCSLVGLFECFSISGELLWSLERKAYAGSDCSFSFSWDLKDSNGRRIPRGIYILRTSVYTDDGLSTTKSKKIAIPAK